MSTNSHSIKKEFTDLYYAESDAIFRYCLLRTSEREVARDMTQDTFMRVWDVLWKKKEIRNLRAFLFTVARNLIIDWYRKKKPQSLEALAEHEEVDVFIPIEDNIQGKIEMETEARYFMSKIRELESSYQHVVYLRFVEGLSPQEIAEILGESVNTVSVRTHRGLEKLRKIVGYEKKIHEQRQRSV